ncbi:MAG: hypothetical protein V4550_08980 [Gemmatimonadota bacterium]
MKKRFKAMTPEALTKYAAEHENEYVQHYVEALLDEQRELTEQLGAIKRSGFTNEGRQSMGKVLRVFLFVGVVAAAFVVGRFSM